jgi:hypothetical protein
MARLYFGRKSDEIDSRQLELLLGLIDPPMPSASADVANPEAAIKTRRKKSRADRCPDNLPVEIEVIDPAPVEVDDQPPDHRHHAARLGQSSKRIVEIRSVSVIDRSL